MFNKSILCGLGSVDEKWRYCIAHPVVLQYHTRLICVLLSVVRVTTRRIVGCYIALEVTSEDVLTFIFQDLNIKSKFIVWQHKFCPCRDLSTWPLSQLSITIHRSRIMVSVSFPWMTGQGEELLQRWILLRRINAYHLFLQECFKPRVKGSPTKL